MECKKANIVPIHKKGDKQTVINYRLVSLLPNCGKIFERLLYNEMLNFVLENDLISQKQSGFRPGDSSINQLLSINHEVLSAFDILSDFLTNRKQRVVLNGQCSSRVDIRAGVPQGSILGPLI